MSKGRRCSICGGTWLVGRHHKFPQTKWARKYYGDLIDHKKNIQYACTNCHAGHASSRLIFWDEREFCRQMGIDPRSQTEKDRQYAD